MGIEDSATRSPGEVPAALPAHPRGAQLPPRGTARDGMSDGAEAHGRGSGDVRRMPDGVREMYAVAMQCIRSGPGHSTRPRPMAPQGSSSRGLMLGGLLLCLFVSLLLLLLPR